jgi:polysaccharide deacetylase 2 family uncharacterized protein YibQ
MPRRLIEVVRRRLQRFARSGAVGASTRPPVWRVALATAAACCAFFVLAIAALWLVAGVRSTPVDHDVVIALPPPSNATVATPSQPTPDADGGLSIPAPGDAAFAPLAALAPEAPLPPAPDPALVQSTAAGPMPRIAADGRLARVVYARPFDRRDKRVKLAVVVGGIGLTRAASEAAITRLPGDVVLAIDAYAAQPDHWARAARQAGHEILATVPMERPDFPFADAGPRALRVADTNENGRRLDAVLSALVGYVGALAVGGTAFVQNAALLEPVLQTLQRRGLLLVEATGNPDSALDRRLAEHGPPMLHVDTVIDEDGGSASIDRQLADFATAARGHSGRIVLAYPSPLTLERVRAWISALDGEGFVLAPVSALVDGRGG